MCVFDLCDLERAEHVREAGPDWGRQKYQDGLW